MLPIWGRLNPCWGMFSYTPDCVGLRVNPISCYWTADFGTRSVLLRDFGLAQAFAFFRDELAEAPLSRCSFGLGVPCGSLLSF